MALTIEGLTKRYTNEGPFAVNGIDLEVGTGEVLILVGESGCGKTTLLKMINRLVAPSAGRVLMDGIDTTSLDPVSLRRSIGFVFQDAALFPHMTVAANVGVTPTLLGWPSQEVADRTTELLQLVGLPSATFAQRYPRELSGGQRQRVGLSRALAASPSLLLLDEPFSALDPLTRDRLQLEFKSLQEALGFTAVFSTHDIAEALLLAHRIAVMREGAIVAMGTPHELLQTESVDDDSAYVVGLLATPIRNAERLTSLSPGVHGE
jgi:osmoprotectant transport system ATP-binding protein